MDALPHGALSSPLLNRAFTGSREAPYPLHKPGWSHIVLFRLRRGSSDGWQEPAPRSGAFS